MINLNLKIVLLCTSLAISLYTKAQYRIEVLDSNTFTLGGGVVLSKTSFRGLSVVDDQTIWVSGSRGTVARSIDGGKTFTYNQLKGYEKSDFRDIEAFDDKRAIIMSSGTPAYILKTIDGGQSWKEVYKNTDTAYFLDAMDFWDDKRGMLVGDPINGHFMLLQTNDGGDSWQELDTTKTPEAMDGEAVFAASGTSLRCWGTTRVYFFVSGGKTSRFFLCDINSGQYKADIINIARGTSSKGTFSMAFSGYEKLFVGGDYLVDNKKDELKYSYSPSSDYGYLYQRRNDIEDNQPGGYRSGAEAIGDSKYLACGTNGADIFEKEKWSFVSKEPFHVVRKAKKGKAVFLAGPKGKIGKLIY